MGRINSLSEQKNTLLWAISYSDALIKKIPDNFKLSTISKTYNLELKKYFSLSALSRSTSAPREIVEQAYDLVFRIRTKIEKSIADSIKIILDKDEFKLELLFQGSFFGCSKKQGVSLRLPLTSCVPSKLCGAACYAHDVLDAAPASIVRGVINGLIAGIYEKGDKDTQKYIMTQLTSHIKKAIKTAIKEVSQLETGWNRRPYIRFSHVGEISEWPNFCNALAKQVKGISNESVDAIIYTRHPKAKYIDTDLSIVNFTLDKGSENRLDWKPDNSRLVYSAFGGEISPEVEVNFLEHHRWIHMDPIGIGKVCPTTLPETKIEDRTCDAVQCNLCFEQPNTE